MPLELATVLGLRHPEDGSPTGLDDIQEVACEWAGVGLETLSDGQEHPGISDGVVSAFLTSADSSARWELRYSRPDADDPAVKWNVIVTALETPNSHPTTVAVRLRRDSDDPRLRPFSRTPAAPRVIKDLLEAPSIQCFDGPLPVKRQAHYLEPESVGNLFVETQLTAADRRLPIIGVAASRSSHHTRIDHRDLARRLAGFAHVYLIAARTLPTLSDAIGPYSLNRESVRIWWPGISVENLEESPLHESWQGPFSSPQETAEEICRLVFSASRDRWSEPLELREFARTLRMARTNQAMQQLDAIHRRISTLQEQAKGYEEQLQVSDQRAEDLQASYEDLASQIDQISQHAESLENERLEFEQAWEEAEAKAERLEAENRNLNARVEHLEHALTNKEDPSSLPGTDEDHFKAQVEQCWKDTFNDSDRRMYQLQGFEIHDNFLESIEAADADRDKVIEVVMEVACGIALKKQGRQLHPFRENAAGGSPQRTRRRDNAKAWRCNIQTNTPSARRLHYWQLNDGTLEFSNVVRHDEETIFE